MSEREVSATSKLEPCLFCGSTHVAVMTINRASYVGCKYCKARGPVGPVARGGRYVADSWNEGIRRKHAEEATDSGYAALAEENERLREQLDEAIAAKDRLKKDRESAIRTRDHMDALWVTTARHLRRARARLHEYEERFAPQPGPVHYQGDGLVTAQRALASCASQEVTCHRPELGFYWWAIAFKYVWRLWSKGQPASDCSKAIDCLERLRGEMGWTDD